MPPLGLRVKGALVVLLCRVALAFAREPERVEALEALRRNYELVGRGTGR